MTAGGIHNFEQAEAVLDVARSYAYHAICLNKTSLCTVAKRRSNRPLWAALPWVSLGVLNAEAQETLTAEGPIDSVTVTGTRIARDGYDAPTPVSVLGAEEIQTSGTANVADFVNTLPSVLGSATASNSSGALSNGQAGIAALNLRSLGTNRTLVHFATLTHITAAKTQAECIFNSMALV